MAVPVEIKPGGNRTMEIVWDNGETSRLSFNLLRRECPCATCREMRSRAEESAPKPASGGIIPLRMASENAPPADPQLRQVDWIGNYAIKLTWEDGHATGIYPYDLLWELAQREDAA
jgi:DUF971 family protein